MKKIIKYLFALLGMVFFMAACEVNDPVLWTKGVTGFEESHILVYFEKEDALDRTQSIEVMLIGKQQKNPIDLTISIDESSTANVSQYDLSGTTITIPANSSYGEIEIDCYRDEFVPGEVQTVVLNLSGESVGPEFQTVTVTIEKELFCPITEASNFIGDYICTEVGYMDYPCTFTLDGVDPLKIWNDNFYDWGADPLYYILSGDLDQTITVPAQTITYGGGYIDTCTGSGYYDGCKGTFHVEYSFDGGTVIHDFNPATGKSSIVHLKKGK